MPKTKNIYFYSIIKYRDTMIGPPNMDVPVAVVVESEDQETAWVMGYTPQFTRTLPPLNQAILHKLPETLVEQFRAARAENHSASLIEVLANKNRWNLYLTKVARIQDSHTLEEITHLLYARYVDLDENVTIPEPTIRRPYLIPAPSWTKHDHSAVPVAVR